MKTCGPNCCPICDFCIHYDFNADKQGRYTGNGWCRLHERNNEPYDECKDFHCSLLQDKTPGTLMALYNDTHEKVK